jgi:hypothetical protein
MKSIRSCEIPLLNLTISSCGTNRGVWVFPGRSKFDVEDVFWFLASQGGEKYRSDAYRSVIPAVRLARCGDPLGGMYQFTCEADLGDHSENIRLPSYTLSWEDNKEKSSFSEESSVPLDSSLREAYRTWVGGVNAPREYGSKGDRA